MRGRTVDEDAACIDRLTSRRHTINALEAAEASDMLDYVDRARAAGERLGGEQVGRLEADAALHELSLARTLAVKSVQDAVCRARRVRSTLPSVWEAWHDGVLSSYQVLVIDRAASRLTRPESVIELDRIAVETSRERTPAQLGSWLSRWVERTEADRVRERHDRAMRDRRVWIRHDGDGMSTITAVVPTLAAAAIESRLDSEARSLPSSDPRTFDQARADMFRDLLLGPADAAGGVRTVIGVTVPLASLMGFSDQPGELANRSASIPPWIIRRAAQEPGTLLYRLVTDDIGNILTASWLGRFAPRQLAQVLEFRDGTSVFPTSSVPASKCDTDHSEPWPAPTSAANTGPVNRKAHNLKTAGLLTMRQPRPGVFEWTTRTGHIYTRHPDPLPIADWRDDLPESFDPRGVPPESPLGPDPLGHAWDHLRAA